MPKALRTLAKSLPGLRRLVEELDELSSANRRLSADLAKWRRGFVAPGHFYSPVVDIESIRKVEGRLFGQEATSPNGINLQEERQKENLERFTAYYADLPFPEEPHKDYRYHLNNDFYAYSDGIILYSMIRHVKPKRFIEVGSGYSSAAALDTNDIFFGGAIDFTFIEPYPERLQRLLRAEDKNRNNVEILRSAVQDVPIDTFRSLKSGDMLFIDSTHVSKTGSDVNFLLFEVLPALEAGVHIHFHDVFYPFEYPLEWIYDGRSWNEAYLLRAFLQYNSTFGITYFSSYMERMYRSEIAGRMPLCIKRPRGELTIPGSLWIQRQST